MSLRLVDLLDDHPGIFEQPSGDPDADLLGRPVRRRALAGTTIGWFGVAVWHQGVADDHPSIAADGKEDDLADDARGTLRFRLETAVREAGRRERKPILLRTCRRAGGADGSRAVYAIGKRWASAVASMAASAAASARRTR